jgi:uncharacterized protein YlzI (FlbEa/FlbD family)
MEKKVSGITRSGKEIWKVDRNNVFAVLDITHENKGFLSVANENTLGHITTVSMQLEDYELKLLKWALRTLEIPQISELGMTLTITWCNGKKTVNKATLGEVIDFLLETDPRRVWRLEVEREESKH